ncbi:hypothetical protein [Microvirga calopogonii]|uniref:hypothetical protein n=1 Tax=Microvirga calopogonii TaxID=2078013 RepID=UPI000E0E02CD|nr:hypothetical protein [Microvirga calopogonii]
MLSLTGLVLMAFDPIRNASLTAELNPFIRAQIASCRHRDGDAVGANLRQLWRPEQRNRKKGAALRSEHARG